LRLNLRAVCIRSIAGSFYDTSQLVNKNRTRALSCMKQSLFTSLFLGLVLDDSLDIFHDYVRAAVLDDRFTESLYLGEWNSFRCKNMLLFLPPNMAAVTMQNVYNILPWNVILCNALECNTYLISFE
jgi:hypothetical protein